MKEKKRNKLINRGVKAKDRRIIEIKIVKMLIEIIRIFKIKYNRLERALRSLYWKKLESTREESLIIGLDR